MTHLNYLLFVFLFCFFVIEIYSILLEQHMGCFCRWCEFKSVFSDPFLIVSPFISHYQIRNKKLHLAESECTTAPQQSHLTASHNIKEEVLFRQSLFYSCDNPWCLGLSCKRLRGVKGIIHPFTRFMKKSTLMSVPAGHSSEQLGHE